MMQSISIHFTSLFQPITQTNMWCYNVIWQKSSTRPEMRNVSDIKTAKIYLNLQSIKKSNQTIFND